MACTEAVWVVDDKSWPDQKTPHFRFKLHGEHSEDAISLELSDEQCKSINKVLVGNLGRECLPRSNEVYSIPATTDSNIGPFHLSFSQEGLLFYFENCLKIPRQAVILTRAHVHRISAQVVFESALKKERHKLESELKTDSSGLAQETLEVRAPAMEKRLKEINKILNSSDDGDLAPELLQELQKINSFERQQLEGLKKEQELSFYDPEKDLDATGPEKIVKELVIQWVVYSLSKAILEVEEHSEFPDCFLSKSLGLGEDANEFLCMCRGKHLNPGQLQSARQKNKFELQGQVIQPASLKLTLHDDRLQVDEQQERILLSEERWPLYAHVETQAQTDKEKADFDIGTVQNATESILDVEAQAVDEEPEERKPDPEEAVDTTGGFDREEPLKATDLGGNDDLAKEYFGLFYRYQQQDSERDRFLYLPWSIFDGLNECIEPFSIATTANPDQGAVVDLGQVDPSLSFSGIKQEHYLPFPQQEALLHYLQHERKVPAPYLAAVRYHVLTLLAEADSRLDCSKGTKFDKVRKDLANEQEEQVQRLTQEEKSRRDGATSLMDSMGVMSPYHLHKLGRFLFRCGYTTNTRDNKGSTASDPSITEEIKHKAAEIISEERTKQLLEQEGLKRAYQKLMDQQSWETKIANILCEELIGISIGELKMILTHWKLQVLENSSELTGTSSSIVESRIVLIQKQLVEALEDSSRQRFHSSGSSRSQNQPETQSPTESSHKHHRSSRKSKTSAAIAEEPKSSSRSHRSSKSSHRSKARSSEDESDRAPRKHRSSKASRKSKKTDSAEESDHSSEKRRSRKSKSSSKEENLEKSSRKHRSSKSSRKTKESSEEESD